MPWYYIGPDKTGLTCSSCCAGFSISSLFNFCEPYPCPVPPSSYRNYFCPNSQNPTPDHVYSWNGNPNSNVTIKANPVICGPSTTCWSYFPSTGLNAAGRIGSGCGEPQVYVDSYYNCHNSTSACPPCPDSPCCEGSVPTGGRGVYRFCATTESGCHCVSGASYDNCGCPACAYNCVLGDPCYNINACGGDGGCPYYEYYTCPDGTSVYYCPAYGPPPCDCPGESPCGACQLSECNAGNWVCTPLSCDPACSAGFVCSCGQCSCTTASTCCPGDARGWSYDSNQEPKCRPCYYGWEGEQPSNCCDSRWKRKNCSTGYVCCRDGRCYPSNTVLCDYDLPY